MNSGDQLVPRIHHDEDAVSSSVSEPETTGSIVTKVALTGLSAAGLGYMTALGVAGAHGTVSGLHKLCFGDDEDSKKKQ